jgi:hypothetical protein
MNPPEKLAAILAAVQTDPGQRGLARLFSACPDDFAAACRELARPSTSVGIITGFFIPNAQPPAPETDGPLGAVFLHRAFTPLGLNPVILAEPNCRTPLLAGMRAHGLYDPAAVPVFQLDAAGNLTSDTRCLFTHPIALERVGPASDGRCYTMRGIDVTERMFPFHREFRSPTWAIGIGDGGNEIGMGKLPHELVSECIPNGDRIHCRIATDHLIVAGVSNWGAYALAAGVLLLRGVKPPADLFDPDHERAVLEVMVREGPLVDGVTGKPTATVDGLSWEAYIQPLVRIREILES